MERGILIEVRDLFKKYMIGELEVPALKNINLKISDNEYVAIIGPSGSGKSTFMNILGCLDTPTSGEYFFRGQDVSKFEDDELSKMRNKEIGFVFQNFNLLPKMNALSNVELPLMYAGLSRKERREKAIEALERVGLADRMEHKPSEMSGGQKQRVAIARALVTKPGILLADEPTGALDSKTGDEIMRLFEDLYKEGNTLVVITHSAEVASLSHRIISIRDGEISSDEVNKK